MKGSFDYDLNAWARRTADLCEPCSRGEHPEATHAELGCIAHTDRPPKDFICKCMHAGHGIGATVWMQGDPQLRAMGRRGRIARLGA